MRTTAIVMAPADFRSGCSRARRRSPRAGPRPARPSSHEGCGGCHTLKAADANGTSGPDLDKLPAYAKQAGQPLEQFVRKSIVDPEAYVEKGYQPVMPKEYGDLPKDQLDALVTFLVQASTRGGPVTAVTAEHHETLRRARQDAAARLAPLHGAGYLARLWTIPLFFGIGAGLDGASAGSSTGTRSGRARSSRRSRW